MRKIIIDDNWHFPKTRRTDFTKEEMLDIIDFYLQYKPMLDEYVDNREHYPQFEPHDFTLLLYMYDIIDVDYIDNWEKIKDKYEKRGIDDLCYEKLDFLEVITVFTAIHRASRNDIYLYDYCIEHDIYYKLLSRLEEIKNELEKEGT